MQPGVSQIRTDPTRGDYSDYSDYSRQVTMAAMVELRRNPGQPWGFRLQGGLDFGQQLTVKKVSVCLLPAARGVLMLLLQCDSHEDDFLSCLLPPDDFSGLLSSSF